MALVGMWYLASPPTWPVLALAKTTPAALITHTTCRYTSSARSPTSKYAPCLCLKHVFSSMSSPLVLRNSSCCYIACPLPCRGLRPCLFTSTDTARPPQLVYHTCSTQKGSIGLTHSAVRQLWPDEYDSLAPKQSKRIIVHVPATAGAGAGAELGAGAGAEAAATVFDPKLVWYVVGKHRSRSWRLIAATSLLSALGWREGSTVWLWRDEGGRVVAAVERPVPDQQQQQQQQPLKAHQYGAGGGEAEGQAEGGKAGARGGYVTVEERVEAGCGSRSSSGRGREQQGCGSDDDAMQAERMRRVQAGKGGGSSDGSAAAAAGAAAAGPSFQQLRLQPAMEPLTHSHSNNPAPIPSTTDLLPAASLTPAHLYGYAGPAPGPPPLQPGELRVCGLTLHPELVPGVLAALQQWAAEHHNDELHAAGGVGYAAAALSEQVCMLGEGPGAAAAASAEAQAPWLSVLRQHSVSRTILAAMLSELLLLQEEGEVLDPWDATTAADVPAGAGPGTAACAAAGSTGQHCHILNGLPRELPDPGRVEPCLDPRRGGMGLRATAPIKKSHPVGVLAGYVMPGAVAKRFGVRGYTDVGEEVAAEVAARAGDRKWAQHAWQLLVGSYSVPYHGPAAEAGAGGGGGGGTLRTEAGACSGCALACALRCCSRDLVARFALPACRERKLGR